CRAQSGFARFDCSLQNLGVDPTCDSTSMPARLQRRVVSKVKAMRAHLGRALSKGPKAFNRALTSATKGLSQLEQTLARAAKRGKITSACDAVLEQQIADLQDQVGGMRK